MVGKKRLLVAAAALASVGAVVALVAGVTFGFFSASTTNTGNTFSAGTVTMGSSFTSTCQVADVLPADTGSCTFTVAYGGADFANLGLDVAVAPNGTQPTSVPECYGAAVTNVPAGGLFDGSNNGLQITGLSDSLSTPYTIGAGGLDLDALTAHTNDLLVAKATSSTAPITFTLDYKMANNGCVDNNYQGASSAFTFTVHAVQSAHNASSGTPGTVDNSISWN
jgi:predicted ribosomally synthesized peptide with SipW-like signal peptide